MADLKRKRFAGKLPPGQEISASAILCMNCDDDKEVRWKCNDCGGEFCDKCKRIHLIAEEGCQNHIVVRLGCSRTGSTASSFDRGSFDHRGSCDGHEPRSQNESSGRRISSSSRSFENSHEENGPFRTEIRLSHGENRDVRNINVDSLGHSRLETVQDSDTHRRTDAPNVNQLKGMFECSFGTADNKTVQHIQVASGCGGDAWIKCGVMSDNIVRASENGKQIDVIKMKGTIQDFAITWKGDILFTKFNDSAIWKHEKNENIKKFAEVPFTANSICITRNRDVMVAAAFGCQDPIAKFTENALSVPFNPTNVPNNLPNIYNMTENINGDVVVTEKGGWGSGRLVALHSSGQFKFEFNGRGKLDPSGVVCDRLGFIFVCDVHCNNVHVLDKEGGYVSILIPTTNLLNSPESVAIDENDVMWIGEGEGVVKLFQLK